MHWKEDVERMLSRLGEDWERIGKENVERIGKRMWSGCDENLARTLKLSNCLQLIISMVLTNSIALTSSMVLTNSIALTNNSIVLIVLH